MDRRRFVQLGVGAAAALLVPEFRPSVWVLDQTMITPQPKPYVFTFDPEYDSWEPFPWMSYEVNEFHITPDGIVVIDDAKLISYSVHPVRYDLRCVFREELPQTHEDQSWMLNYTVDMML